MAWKPQGGGPWGGGGGGGGQGPWGGGSQGGGQQPPDIEEMLKRSQDRFKQMLPGGFGSFRGVVLAVLAIFALWMGSGVYRVEAGHEAVVLLFGKYTKTSDPGLHWFFPTPIGTVLKVDVQSIRRVDVGYRSTGDVSRVSGTGRDIPAESLMLTGDQNIIDLNFTVQWSVKDPQAYVFNIRNPDKTVKAATESAMREVIGQTDLESALTGGRGQIEAKAHALIQKILDSYGAGISIARVQLLKVDPPSAVIDAFNEVQRARQDKVRKQNEAQAYMNKVVPTARGEAQQVIKAAEAYRQRVVKEAEGEAKRFTSVYDAYKKAKDVTVRRLYIEGMEAVLRNTPKTIIDQGKGGTNVVPYLPLSEIQKNRGGSSK
ncbi:FtsH protease activity modulator HflK [Varunaivibrio sulfuroxidans]|uniref:Protein HflK n=1 Tax=Varunaivibrio sulfuroxidans TaxID=1773489 RepID=A0A4R3J7U4_9PROT|nr:FtsH protease activity modulator HflK [Varunaivibrio sulfuroxidans]TCS60976.1 protease FtsH subunit HflK [Varunaivibrio sulfuroxidans]WES31617.1 FtsH protease activity modulator HflK [Varunaivibrio sulfuroxidans]